MRRAVSVPAGVQDDVYAATDILLAKGVTFHKKPDEGRSSPGLTDSRNDAATRALAPLRQLGDARKRGGDWSFGKGTRPLVRTTTEELWFFQSFIPRLLPAHSSVSHAPIPAPSLHGRCRHGGGCSAADGLAEARRGHGQVGLFTPSLLVLRDLPRSLLLLEGISVAPF